MRRSYRANDVVKEAIDDYVDEFDSVLLENRMHTVDDGDELVHHYAESIASSQHACNIADERYGYRDDLCRVAGDAAEKLEEQLEAHLDVLVAEECAIVAQREGDWTDRRDDAQVEAAVHEAREWLQVNREAAERAGVWDALVA